MSEEELSMDSLLQQIAQRDAVIQSMKEKTKCMCDTIYHLQIILSAFTLLVVSSICREIK